MARRPWVLPVTVALLVLVVVVLVQLRSAGDDSVTSSPPPDASTATGSGVATCPPPPGGEIACENSRDGDPSSEWDVRTRDSGDPDLQGFATQMSVDVGETVTFKVRSTAPDYRLDIYRLGHYGGDGARKVATVDPDVPLPQVQPDCVSNPGTGLVDCGNWAASASWPVPSDATSGIYLAHLVRDDTDRDSHIVFIVRDDDARSDIVLKVPDATWAAYNSFGGNSLYEGAPVGRAYAVSYNRPSNLRGSRYTRASLFDSVYPMVRFLEANGYDVTYTTASEVDANLDRLLQHRLFLSVGHDEYWSGAERAGVEAARDAGVNLAFFSGNTMFWKTRWEPSIDGSGQPYRTLVSYKESTAGEPIDPAAPTWTGTWRDTRYSPPGDGGRPENALTGLLYAANCCAFEPITVSAEEGRLRFWRNTGLDEMDGEATTLTGGLIGYEFDTDADNGARPAGQIDLSTTVVDDAQVLADESDLYSSGSVTHQLAYHRASSGALVFGAGTIHWSWGLDDEHDSTDVAAPPTDARIQQATVNVLADMGAQPVTLVEELVRAEPSTDDRAPTSTITTRPAAAPVTTKDEIVVRGTATDPDGGAVGGVEVSTDDGATWHQADGRESWTYTFAPDEVGPITVAVRATDDSLNTEVPGPPVTVGVATCPCTIFGSSTRPKRPVFDEKQSVQLGLKFRADRPGVVTGVRFYKGPGNTGPHIGHLWSGGGELLATVAFTGETESGWQQATFAEPIPITASTTYVVSYWEPMGIYSGDNGAFTGAGVVKGHLQALASGVDGPNGVFSYGEDEFPTSTFKDSNYFVDVLFTPDG